MRRWESMRPVAQVLICGCRRGSRDDLRKEAVSSNVLIALRSVDSPRALKFVVLFVTSGRARFRRPAAHFDALSGCMWQPQRNRSSLSSRRWLSCRQCSFPLCVITLLWFLFRRLDEDTDNVASAATDTDCNTISAQSRLGEQDLKVAPHL